MKNVLYVLFVGWLIYLGIPMLFVIKFGIIALFIFSFCLSIFIVRLIKNNEQYKLYSDIYDKIKAARTDYIDSETKIKKILDEYNLNIDAFKSVDLEILNRKSEARTASVDNENAILCTLLLGLLFALRVMIDEPFTIINKFWESVIFQNRVIKTVKAIKCLPFLYINPCRKERFISLAEKSLFLCNYLDKNKKIR